MKLRPLLGSHGHWKCQSTMCSRKSQLFVTGVPYFKLGRQTNALLVGEIESPGQRRLLPAPEPDHHGCWEVQVAVWPPVALSAYELPPAPPAASWTSTEGRWSSLKTSKYTCSALNSYRKGEYKMIFLGGVIVDQRPHLVSYSCTHVWVSCSHDCPAVFQYFPQGTFVPKPLSHSPVMFN